MVSGEQSAAGAALGGSPWSGRFAAVLAASVALVVYVLALSPVVLDGDSADLALQACRLGLAYPPGYFLNAMFGGLLTTLVPFGTVAWRANLLAALASTASVFLAYGILRCWCVSRGVAILGAWMLAFSPLFLSQSLYVNAYAVNVTFALAVVYLLEKWSARRGLALLATSAALFGLGLSAHPSFILYLPAVLVYVTMELRRDGRVWRGLGVATAALLTGCVPWLVYTVMHLLSRGQYRSFGHFFERLVVFLTAADSPSDWREYFTVVFLKRYMSGLALHGVRMLAQFSLVGVVLGVVGVVALWRRRRLSLALVGLAYLMQMNFAVTMPLWHHFDVYRLSAYALWALLMGMGLMAIAARTRSGWGRAAVPVVLAVLAIGMPYGMLMAAPEASARGADRLRLLRPQPVSRTWFAVQNSLDCASALEYAPPESVVLSTWGSFATMQYLQRVEGLNREAQLVCFGGTDQMERFIAKHRATGNPNVLMLLRSNQHQLLRHVQGLYRTESMFDGVLQSLYRLGDATAALATQGAGEESDSGSRRRGIAE